jgi:membrane associated rhomboid family serine protease
MASYRDNPLGFGFNIGMTPGVKLLLIANVAAFLAMLVPGVGMWIGNWFGLTPALVLRGAIWQLFTYQFLHAGIGHIFFNLLTLWMFGTAIEGAWGQRRFLRYFLVCGVGAGVCVVLVAYLLPAYGDRLAITVGASGAIYGLLLAFGIMYPNAPILLFLLFPVPAKYAVMIFGAIEFFGFASGGSGVSHVAHLGGLLVGYLYLHYGGFTSSSYGYASRRSARAGMFTKWFSVEEWRIAYEGWRRRRLRKKFEGYMRKHGGDGDGYIQ